MASLSSWRLFGLSIALTKSTIHLDSETGCEPYVAGYSCRKNLGDTVRINSQVYSPESVQLSSYYDEEDSLE